MEDSILNDLYRLLKASDDFDHSLFNKRLAEITGETEDDYVIQIFLVCYSVRFRGKREYFYDLYWHEEGSYDHFLRLLKKGAYGCREWLNEERQTDVRLHKALNVLDSSKSESPNVQDAR